MIPMVKVIVSEDEKKLVKEVLNSGMLAQGSKVKQFEENFAKYSGSKYAVAVNSGTAALHCALFALGIKEGDEVITSPFTFVATANSIAMCGAKPVFVDIREDTFTIDPSKIEEKITSKTKAIIAVDLFGQPADYDEIQAIADKHNLKVVADSCQAIGASLNGKKSGSLADASCFSLYATKNIMCGEGGVVTTDDPEVEELVKRFRHHGQSEKTRYEYYHLGYNYRLTDLQAAIAIGQLDKTDQFNSKRQNNAKFYFDNLKDVSGLTLPFVKEGVNHVFHQFSILCENRDEIISKLKENEVGHGIFYPKPLHMHPNFKKYGYKEGDFPISERISKSVLSLPIHPHLTEDDLNKVVSVLRG